MTISSKPLNAPLRFVRQSGSVTAILALFLLAMVFFAQQVITRSAGTAAFNASLQGDAVEAMLLAESGLERAIKRFYDGTACGSLATDGPHSVGRGSFTITNSYSTHFDGSTALGASECRVRVEGKITNTNVIRTIEGILDNGSGSLTPSNDAWAVDASGEIWHWNGSSWALSASGSVALYAVYCVDSSDCWAVGASGKARHWNGTAWSTISSGTSSSLNGISCVPGNGNKCYAAGNSGTMRYWNGTSWASSSVGTSYHLRDVDCPSTTCYTIEGYTSGGMMGGSTHGDVYRGNSAGWTRDYINTSYEMRAVDCYADDDCRSAGESSSSYFYSWSGTGNSPSTWSRQSIAESPVSSRILRGISCPASNDCWAVGDDTSSGGGGMGGGGMGGGGMGGGTTYYYTLLHWNGSSWSQQMLSDSYPQDMNDISCASATECFAVGDNGKHLYYNGTSWTEQSSFTSTALYGIYFLPDIPGSPKLLEWREPDA